MGLSIHGQRPESPAWDQDDSDDASVPRLRPAAGEPRLTVGMTRMERGQLKALADVTIPTELGEIAIRGFRVIEKEGQAPWVGFPTSGYVKDGKPRNYPLLDLPASLRRRIVESILAEYETRK